ncbi:MAG TPA: carbon storage regulator [Thiobacillus sp.]
MLTFTRKEGEAFVLILSPDIDPQTPIGEVLAGGPIVVHISRVRGRAAKVGVDAPLALDVVRQELLAD